MKKIASLALVGLFTASLCGSADASWLSKTLDKLDAWTSSVSDAVNSSSHTRPTTQTVSPSKKENRDSKEYKLKNQEESMILLGSNQYYTTYLDTKGISATGVAPNRYVKAQVVRMFTPLGSQWLGNTSDGLVKPDVITVSVTPVFWFWERGSFQGTDTFYYDVYANLVHKGRLHDVGYSNGGMYDYAWATKDYITVERYVPNSELEHMKDKVFALVDWES